jgi:hypothetical protein
MHPCTSLTRSYEKPALWKTPTTLIVQHKSPSSPLIWRAYAARDSPRAVRLDGTSPTGENSSPKQAQCLCRTTRYRLHPHSTQGVPAPPKTSPVIGSQPGPGQLPCPPVVNSRASVSAMAAAATDTAAAIASGVRSTLLAAALSPVVSHEPGKFCRHAVDHAVMGGVGLRWSGSGAQRSRPMSGACFYAEQCRLCVLVLCLACPGPAPRRTCALIIAQAGGGVGLVESWRQLAEPTGEGKPTAKGGRTTATAEVARRRVGCCVVSQ